MASTRRGYVPVDTTTVITKRRRLSAFNTCIHSEISKWKEAFSFKHNLGARRCSFHNHQPGQKVHFRPHSDLYSNTSTSSFPNDSAAYRHSHSSTVPLKPILKSSAAYRQSLQASRSSYTTPSFSTQRRASTSHDIRPAQASISTSRRSFATSRPSISVSRSSTSISPTALQDTQNVALTLLTMSPPESVASRLSTFHKHFNHLTHRVTTLSEASIEASEASVRQLALQNTYLSSVDRQTKVMNELAMSVGREVDDVLGMHGRVHGGDGSDDTGNSSDEDIESFLGRKLVFEPLDVAMGREISVLDIDLRHRSIREEMEVVKAQMALETLDRGKLFRGFQKLVRDLRDEIQDVAEEKEIVGKTVRRHGGRSERREFEGLEGRLKEVRRQYQERSRRIGEEWLKMDERDFFKR